MTRRHTTRTVLTRSPELPNPGKYPVALWEQQRAKYWEYWRHFDGDWLDDHVSATDDSLRYPLQLNPFNMACILHDGMLFGEVQDSNDPLVTSVVEPWGRNSSQEERDRAAFLSDLVNRVWCENEGRAIQQEAGLISQILGGCVFGVFYDPTRIARGKLPIRIDHLLPEYFFPVPAPEQYWQLLEAIVAFEITQLQAEQTYGVKANYDRALYQEHWKRNSYDITVEGKPVSWYGMKMEGRYPLGGQVPYTYIPHIRVGDFYGVSLLDRKLGLAKEINDRFADVGDIVSTNARMLPAIANARKIGLKRIGTGTTFLDLGQAAPGMDSPKITYPDASSTHTSSATVDWATELLNVARTEAYTPPVCYGVDEGSQRSSMTLVMRMLPLVVHIRQERTLWTSGLDQVGRMILTIAAEKGIEGVTQADIRDIRLWQEWAPMLPRDHDQLVNELILRLNAGLLSPETALERLGDIRDTQTELKLIKAWMEYTSQLTVQQQSPFEGAGSRGEQAGMNRPSEPNPSVKKEE